MNDEGKRKQYNDRFTDIMQHYESGGQFVPPDERFDEFSGVTKKMIRRQPKDFKEEEVEVIAQYTMEIIKKYFKKGKKSTDLLSYLTNWIKQAIAFYEVEKKEYELALVSLMEQAKADKSDLNRRIITENEEEVNAKLYENLGKIKPQFRDFLFLHYGLGKSLTDVAIELDVDKKNIYSIHARSLEAIRKVYGIKIEPKKTTKPPVGKH